MLKPIQLALPLSTVSEGRSLGRIPPYPVALWGPALGLVDPRSPDPSAGHLPLPTEDGLFQVLIQQVEESTAEVSRTAAPVSLAPQSSFF